SSEEKVSLGALGQYLRRTDSGFSPKNYGHASLLNMLKTYKQLVVSQDSHGHWVKLAERKRSASGGDAGS
ncbi:MAG: OST-HTH/LOTUS domain-containing protein, partial [Candidatus Accumulibacter sp.]|nr:OST-HTH/LOTUS domain-containing protein [Accumulibacter sp.]